MVSSATQVTDANMNHQGSPKIDTSMASGAQDINMAQVAAQATKLTQPGVAAQNRDICTDSCGNIGRGHQHGSQMHQDHHRPRHGPKRQHRPQTSTWPPAVEQTMNHCVALGGSMGLNVNTAPSCSTDSRHPHGLWASSQPGAAIAGGYLPFTGSVCHVRSVLSLP